MLSRVACDAKARVAGMKWHKYTKEFAKVDADGQINYKEFLSSYRISLTALASLSVR